MTSEIENQWQVSEGEYNGSPLIVRINTGVQKMAKNGEYSFRIGIAVPVIKPQKNGLPNRDENKTLAQIEDVIVQNISAEKSGLLCIVITTQGMREFVCYMKDSSVEDLITLLRSSFTDYIFQTYTQEDSDWSGYYEWYP